MFPGLLPAVIRMTAPYLMMHHRARIALVLMLACGATSVVLADEAGIKFNRDIRPILAENCFTCHGPDKNKAARADLRLDTQAAASGQDRRPSRDRAWQGGRERTARPAVATDDDGSRMPPPAT